MPTGGIMSFIIAIVILYVIWTYRKTIKSLASIGEDYTAQFAVSSKVTLAKDRVTLAKEIDSLGEIPSISSLEAKLQGK